jgi:hypothetical protein
MFAHTYDIIIAYLWQSKSCLTLPFWVLIGCSAKNRGGMVLDLSGTVRGVFTMQRHQNNGNSNWFYPKRVREEMGKNAWIGRSKNLL